MVIRMVSAKEKLKILHIAGWHPSKEKPVAGIFVREHIRATSLYEDVIVLIAGVADTLKSLFPLYRLISEDYNDGIPTFRLFHKAPRIRFFPYISYIISTYLASKKIIDGGFRPDIIHAHEYTAGVPAVILGRRFKIPVVITEHWTGFPRGMLDRIELLKAKFAFERADMVCPVSRDLQTCIERFGIKASFRVIPNAVDTSLFFPCEDKASKSEGKKELLCVALLHPKKGIPYLLEAMAILKKERNDLLLNIVGDGPNRQEYEEMVKNLSLDELVRFYGLQPKEKVAEFMRQADLFVFPSLWENLPCVLIEAMASGLPIVATKVGGIPEIVDDEVGILVPPKNSAKLAEAINYAIDNLKKFQRDKIVKRAKERYSYQAVGKALSNLYREIIGRRKEKK
jgi:glycosyltransferase involved in cell wall biosynthesis